MGKPAVLIFRSELVGLTEGFVLAQGEGLAKHTAYYLGVRRLVPGLSPPTERTFFVNDGGARFAPREIRFKVLGRLGRIGSRLRALDPVLVHAHFGMEGLRILPWARRERLPLVVTYHGYDALVRDEYARNSHYGHRKYARNKHDVARYASRSLAVSDFVRRRLLEQGFPNDRCVVHYVGVDLERFSPDPAVVREPIVLFVGRLIEGKGCGHLIDAMADIQEHLPGVRLVVVGDGDQRASLERDARRRLRACQFTGALAPDQVRGWMNRASVLSVPSVPLPNGHEEALGLVFAEAQAMGTPVVSFATGGIPEVVADGETGFLVPPRDVQALAARLVTVLRSNETWQRLSDAAIARMRARFDLRRQNAKLEEVYTEVVAESRRAPR